jgi:methyl-accepting chemotaxis protein
VIRSISDKSDLLALNASLEGTKAGEAGRGFALVAAEMRRLAESVMAAAREIKALASNIRTASDSSVHAADEGRTLAGRTSESAREITLVTVQQRNATEQVTSSMDEVSQLLTRSAEGTRATERAAQALSQLADQLTQLTSKFAAQTARS